MSRSAIDAARRALDEAHDFEDPWLLSYADLVTNLLAFFVLIVSMATISFTSLDDLPAAFDSSASTQPNLRTLSADVRELISDEGLRGQVVAELDAQGLAIQLQDQIVFASGVATLSTEGAHLVDRIGRLLQRLPDKYRVIVEGHTDDVPIATAQFRSNWALSAARALEVRDGLARLGIADERLAITAYADTRPVPSPETEPVERRRQKNRRVVIRVY